ncbi:MFS transporter [Actinomadura alba]|uniref:MFS transporter n=1 Tax=Actinomadura alba TaxID=406431 RepID=A0ABR7LWW6_9ACTN|nr:MFS transporter [Actinomadura alba]
MAANRPFRLLWSARAVSFLGDSLSLVALMLYVADTTGQALAVALLLLVGDFAPALLGPLTGAVSDRFDRKRVMVASELVQGGVLVVIALWLPSTPLLLVLVGVRAMAGQIFQPASRAAVPALVRDRDLQSANAAVGIGTNGGEALGPLLAALLLPVLGIRGVLLLDAATFLVSAALLTFLPATRRRPPEHDRPESLPAAAAAGLRHIASSRVLRAIGLGYFAVVAFNGIDDVALVFLARDTLGGAESAVGMLLAAVGIGLFLGYGLLSRPGRRMSMIPLLIAGFAVSSAGNLLTGLAWAVAAAFIVQVGRGLGIAAMDVAAGTLIQRTVPEDMLGRVFGSLYGAIGVAAALSYVCGGLLLDVTTPPVAFLVAGTGGLVATLATALSLRRADSP